MFSAAAWPCSNVCQICLRRKDGRSASVPTCGEIFCAELREGIAQFTLFLPACFQSHLRQGLQSSLPASLSPFTATFVLSSLSGHYLYRSCDTMFDERMSIRTEGCVCPSISIDMTIMHLVADWGTLPPYPEGSRPSLANTV